MPELPFSVFVLVVCVIVLVASLAATLSTGGGQLDPAVLAVGSR